MKKLLENYFGASHTPEMHSPLSLGWFWWKCLRKTAFSFALFCLLYQDRIQKEFKHFKTVRGLPWQSTAAGGAGSIRGWGPKIPMCYWHGQKFF